jgi:penicillin amidase
LAEIDPAGNAIGSNNWTVAASRTATGRPILANDPHREHSVPSLRYVVHLNAPGMSVIGAGEPALPGISIGHNGQIAFGFTIFAIDQEDLYVYETHPENLRQSAIRTRSNQWLSFVKRSKSKGYALRILCKNRALRNMPHDCDTFIGGIGISE